MPIPETTHAFAALTSIKAGLWDDVLPQFRIAIQQRMSDQEYEAHILRRAEFIAGVPQRDGDQ